ncbi:MAG: MarR family winged helix-turn-helix transcriptional regulator [Sphingobacterium sp.]
MNKDEKKFYEVFTNLQCFILANMNKVEVNGIRATHYNIIEHIYRHDNCTGKEIAIAFNISQAAISKQLKFLIENTLIEQVQSTTDRRIFNLSVTDKGRSIIDNSENFRETVAKKVYKGLTADDFRKLTSLLDKVIDHIM